MFARAETRTRAWRAGTALFQGHWPWCKSALRNTSQGQHKVVVVAATVTEGFGRTGGIRNAVMKKLGAQSDGSPLLAIQELVIGGRPITEKKFGWRNGNILLVSRLSSHPAVTSPVPEGFSAPRESW